MGEQIEILAHAHDHWWRVRVSGQEGYALLSPEEFDGPFKERLAAIVQASREDQDRLLADEKREVLRALESEGGALTARLTKSRPLQIDPLGPYRRTTRSRKLPAGTELPIVGAALSPLGLGGEYWTVEDGGKIRYISSDESVETYLRGERLSPTAAEFAFRYLAVKSAEADRHAKPFLIYAAIPQPPDSAGGVDVLLPIENLDSARVIKYVTLELTPYNAVGDPVADRISDTVSRPVRATGPIRPGDFSELVSEGVWYNHTIVCVQVTEVVVEYFESAPQRIEPESVLSHHFANDCSYSPN